jgi:hypothetical protein
MTLQAASSSYVDLIVEEPDAASRIEVYSSSAWWNEFAGWDFLFIDSARRPDTVQWLVLEEP